MRPDNQPKFLKAFVTDRINSERRKIIAEFCQDIDRRIAERRATENQNVANWFEKFERAKTSRG